ncbi:Cadherin-like and PC-esterase domain-containing protein 1 [Hypsibius exemplaris]|uniref:Cadherin-like and PC-esterase domain-containing protein 1 n=1 Tax=Hypsibius exemplaris TaxID=2072580 RepID=A0A1W0XCB1_HYPEX|nr:Cadherin-like and PC-esterase domain-containing protein 1 [Hypsibius exemplaris]
MFTWHFFMTIRRDRMLIKLALISLFFTGCYLSKYSAPARAGIIVRQRSYYRGSNLVAANEEFNELNAITADGDADGGPLSRKCPRMPVGDDGSTANGQIREVIRSIQQEAASSTASTYSNPGDYTRMQTTAPANLVAISGLQGTASVFADPLTDSYEKALRNSGYVVEILSGSNYKTRRRKRQAVDVESNFTYAAVFCLRHQGHCRPPPAPTGATKVNRIDGFKKILSILNDETICQQGKEQQAFVCYPPGANISTTSVPRTATVGNTAWVVTQQGVPTFATVPEESLPQFYAELQRASNLSARWFAAPAFTILDRPVRMSVFVLAVGNSPAVFYLHQEGVVRIGSFVNYSARQERDTELIWTFAQFRKYLQDRQGTSSATDFFRNVRTTVARVFHGLHHDRQTDGSCRDCYQLLEVTLFVSASLEPSVVTVTDHAQLRDLQMPSRILENTITLLLDRNPIDTEAAGFLERQIGSIVSTTDWKEACDNTVDVSCARSSDLRSLTETAIFRIKAQNYGFAFIGLSSSQDGREWLAKDAELVLSCLEDDYNDYGSQYSSKDSSQTLPFEKRCQYDSIFRSLLMAAKTFPAFPFQPSFHPLITTYAVNVPFNITSVDMEFIPADCATEISLASQTGTLNARRESFTVGIGENILTINVAKRSPTGAVPMRSYTFKLFRQDRDDVSTFDQKEVLADDNSTVTCSWMQTCDLKLYPNEPCGIQQEPAQFGSNTTFLCDTNQTERWILPCRSCSDESSCAWSKAVWSPDLCGPLPLKPVEVEQCLQNKKLVFIGDSTNRGIMAYMMQKFNGTLWEDEKIHSVKSYENLNGVNTSFTFAYYPQFWLPRPHRPSFSKTFHQALKAAGPLQNNSETVFVVGGLQFMSGIHVRELQKSLTKAKLEGAHVVIKTLGAGFFVPAHGVRHVSPDGLAKLVQVNQEIVAQSRQLGYQLVDTFAMTTSRYNEFSAGKCSCHFHSIIQNPPVSGNPKKTFSVRGRINALYSQSVLRQICSTNRN